MPPPNRRRTRQPISNDRTDLDALSVGDVFASAIDEVMQMRDSGKFTGVVDVGVTFKSVAVDRDGFLSVVVGGNDSQETTTQIQLATRVHLEKEA